MSGCNMQANTMRHGTYNIPHTPCNMEHTTYRMHHAATSMHIQCASCDGDRSSAECTAQNNVAVLLEAMLHVGMLCCNVACAIIVKYAATSHVCWMLQIAMLCAAGCACKAACGSAGAARRHCLLVVFGQPRQDLFSVPNRSMPSIRLLPSVGAADICLDQLPSVAYRILLML
jgi:hypothetical protein